MVYKSSNYNLFLKEKDKVFVFNTRAGSLIRLEDDECDDFRKFLENPSEGSRFFTSSKRLGYIVNKDLCELSDIRLRFIKRKTSSSHLHFTIFVTLDCNLDCSYCYEEKKKLELNDSVSSQIVGFLDKITSDSRPKSFSVTWMGGEPLLNLRQIKRLSSAFIELSRKLGIEYTASLVTNGTMLEKLTDDEIQSLGLKNIQITIDGPKEVHDSRRKMKNGGSSFACLTNAVADRECLLEKLSIRINLDKTNLEHFDSLLNEIERRGLSDAKITFSKVDDDTRIHPELENVLFCQDEFSDLTAELTDKLLERDYFRFGLPSPKGISCQAYGLNNYVISPEGLLLKCNHDAYEGKDKAFGSVFDNGIRHENLMPYIDFDIFEDMECRECNLLPICMGPCIYALRKTGEKKCFGREMFLEKRVWHAWMKKGGGNGDCKGSECRGD